MGGLHFNLEAYTPNKKTKNYLHKVWLFISYNRGGGNRNGCFTRPYTLFMWNMDFLGEAGVNKPEFETKYMHFLTTTVYANWYFA